MSILALKTTGSIPMRDKWRQKRVTWTIFRLYFAASALVGLSVVTKFP